LPAFLLNNNKIYQKQKKAQADRDFLSKLVDVHSSTAYAELMCDVAYVAHLLEEVWKSGVWKVRRSG
jgi:acetolactate synthase small subunit